MPGIYWPARGVLATPPPKQKGATCYAHATAGILQASLEILDTDDTRNLLPSTQQAIDCCLHEGGSKGGSLEDSLDCIKKHGISSLKNYKMIAGGAVRGECKVCIGELVPDIRLSDYVIVRDADIELEALKLDVAQRPVAVSFNCGIEFDYYIKGTILRDGLYPDVNKDKGIGGHAAIIVGYNENEKGVPYWDIRNSWGPKWGDNGCMKLHQDQTHLFCYYAYPLGVSRW